MKTIEKSVEVECPLHTVYNQWTQFEEFPRFMNGVKKVTQLDDQRLHWEAEIAGKNKEWDSRITDQVPDQLIAWQSDRGEYNAGAVHFSAVSPNCTRVNLQLMYDPLLKLEHVLLSEIGIYMTLVMGTMTGSWRELSFTVFPARARNRYLGPDRLYTISCEGEFV